MTDANLRQLEREADDPEARAKLRHERCRRGECCAHATGEPQQWSFLQRVVLGLARQAAKYD